MLPAGTIESRLRHFSRNNAEREAILKACSQNRLRRRRTDRAARKARKDTNVIVYIAGRKQLRNHRERTTWTTWSRGDGWWTIGAEQAFAQSVSKSGGRARKYTFVFIGFTQEEEGLIGSHSM